MIKFIHLRNKTDKAAITVAWEIDDQTMYVAVAFCSPKEKSWCRAKGRLIAQSRLETYKKLLAADNEFSKIFSQIREKGPEEPIPEHLLVGRKGVLDKLEKMIGVGAYKSPDVTTQTRRAIINLILANIVEGPRWYKKFIRDTLEPRAEFWEGVFSKIESVKQHRKED